MSHINVDLPQQADQRISWQSIPESDVIDDSSVSEIEAHHGQSLSLLSAVSRTQSRDIDDNAPASNEWGRINEVDTHNGQRLSSLSLDFRHGVDAHVPTTNDNRQRSEGDDSLRYPVQNAISSASATVMPKQSSEEARISKTHKSSNFDKTTTSACDWSPYTLRRPYLISFASICLALTVVLAVLSWYSATHHGLGKDDGSTGRFFGWRYAPTLIAVLFTQALVMIAEDIKQTEAFARLSQAEPPTAKSTLFYIPKVWWKNVLPQRVSGGHKTWTLSLSSLAAGLSLLVISSFSSSVLIAKDITYFDPVPIHRYMPGLNGTIGLVPRWDTYFRTINAHLYNVSTSTWVSDSHVILPIVPMRKDLGTGALNTGTWKAETTILQMENDCVPMTLVQKTEFKTNYSFEGDQPTCVQNDTCPEQQYKGLELRSTDGCSVQIHSEIRSNAMATYGGIYWTNMSSSYVSIQDRIRSRGDRPLMTSAEQWTISRVFIYHLSDECRGRDLLLATPPWSERSRDINVPVSEAERLYWENFTIQAELCTPNIYEAMMPVKLEISGNISNATFDTSEFTRRRKSPTKTLFDLSRLDDLAFRETWPKYAIKPLGDASETTVHGFEGVESFLAQHYEMDINAVIRSKTLGAEASRFRGRFFGELILSSILQADDPALENTISQFEQQDRRIMVVTEAVITLVISLLLVLCYLLYLYWQIMRNPRALQLSVDPATIVGTASVLAPGSTLARDLRSSPEQSFTKAKRSLETRVYAMQKGIVIEATSGRVKQEVKSRSKFGTMTGPWKRQRPLEHTERPDWRPFMLKKKWLSALLAFLVVLAVVLLVLRRYAWEERLNRTAFIYQINLGLLNTTLSPHSIIATLVAVIVGLLWDSIDKPLRKLQPYLTMTRGTSTISQGALLSYQTSYWIWAATKAARRKHWLLCLVTSGTTMTQILVVSMAAIFEKRIVLQHDVVAKLSVWMRQPEMRQAPLVFSIGLASRPFHLTEAIVDVSQADWLSTALDEVMLGSPPPMWTKNEWIFPPVEFHSTNGSDSGVEYFGLDVLSPSANITINTPAFRSRLECSSIPISAPGWLDRAEHVFPNQTKPPSTGYVLPMTLFDGEPYNTSVFSAPRRMACCTNDTNPSGASIVAYWSSNSPIIDVRLSEPSDKTIVTEPTAWTTNFTIKWILGHARTTLLDGQEFNGSAGKGNYVSPGDTLDDKLLYFPEEPQISAINCKPIIEQANANITVARYTGQVLDAKILGQPQPNDTAWAYMWDVADVKTETIPFTFIWNGVKDNQSTASTEDYKLNVSSANFFLAQLLSAPHMLLPRSSRLLVYNRTLEDVSIERFSIRDKQLGINMDFMSRANFFQAGDDADALLNVSALIEHSQHTFQTFFKHFVARGSVGKESAFWNDNVDGSIDGTVAQHVQVLKMNETATWLSLAIIFLLIAILAVVIVALQIVYPKTCMEHPVECLADTLMMVAGSDEFVDLVHEGGIEKSNVRTRLGWFKDRRGVDRWGIEIVDGNGE